MKTELHLKELPHSLHNGDARIFRGYLVGATNIYTAGLTPQPEMNSKQAISWCLEVERQAFAHNVECIRIEDNF